MEQYKDIQDILNDFSFLLWPCRADCWILVPPPGIEPVPSALEAWSLTTGLQVKSLIPDFFLKIFPPLV